MTEDRDHLRLLGPLPVTLGLTRDLPRAWQGQAWQACQFAASSNNLPHCNFQAIPCHRCAKAASLMTSDELEGTRERGKEGLNAKMVGNRISFEWSRLQTFLPRNLEGEQWLIVIRLCMRKDRIVRLSSQVLIQLEGTLKTQNQNSWGFITASAVKKNLTRASPPTTNLEPGISSEDTQALFLDTVSAKRLLSSHETLQTPVFTANQQAFQIC
jgi:hypothetical protein